MGELAAPNMVERVLGSSVRVPALWLMEDYGKDAMPSMEIERKRAGAEVLGPVELTAVRLEGDEVVLEMEQRCLRPEP